MSLTAAMVGIGNAPSLPPERLIQTSKTRSFSRRRKEWNATTSRSLAVARDPGFGVHSALGQCRPIDLGSSRPVGSARVQAFLECAGLVGNPRNRRFSRLKGLAPRERISVPSIGRPPSSSSGTVKIPRFSKASPIRVCRQRAFETGPRTFSSRRQSWRAIHRALSQSSADGAWAIVPDAWASARRKTRDLTASECGLAVLTPSFATAWQGPAEEFSHRPRPAFESPIVRECQASSLRAGATRPGLTSGSSSNAGRVAPEQAYIRTTKVRTNMPDTVTFSFFVYALFPLEFYVWSNSIRYMYVGVSASAASFEIP